MNHWSHLWSQSLTREKLLASDYPVRAAAVWALSARTHPRAAPRQKAAPPPRPPPLLLSPPNCRTRVNRREHSTRCRLMHVGFANRIAVIYRGTEANGGGGTRGGYTGGGNIGGDKNTHTEKTAVGQTGGKWSDTSGKSVLHRRVLFDDPQEMGCEEWAGKWASDKWVGEGELG